MISMGHFLRVLFASHAIAPNLVLLKNPNTFRVSPDGVKTIIDPTKSMIVNNVKFYWSGYYKPSTGVTVPCELEEPPLHWGLGVVRYENGSKPTGIQFECPSANDCISVECRVDDRLNAMIVLAFVLLTFATCFVALVYVQKAP